MAVLELSTSEEPPTCHHSGCGITWNGAGYDKEGMMQCLDCHYIGCTRGLDREDPRGHALSHAASCKHYIAQWYDVPNLGYCFKCVRVMRLSDSPELNEEECSEEDRKIKEQRAMVASKTLAAGKSKDNWGTTASSPRVDWPTVASSSKVDLGNVGRTALDQRGMEAGNDAAEYAIGNGYIIRGMANHGNTCYMNASLQCLLAFGKLRIIIRGPDPRLGNIGLELKRLFLETGSVNKATAMLDPQMILVCMQLLYQDRFGARKMEDSHEFLKSFHSALDNEVEELNRSNVMEGGGVFPTFGHSMFKCARVMRLSDIQGKVDRKVKDEQGIMASKTVVASKSMDDWGIVASSAKVDSPMVASSSKDDRGIRASGAKVDWPTVSSSSELDLGNEASYALDQRRMNDACSRAAEYAIGNGYIIRGMPNHGNTCYMNASLQCLLALGKLRTMILSPDARLGDLGLHLKQLFVATNSGNNSRHMMDPKMIVKYMWSHHPERFKFTEMGDSHEFLTSLRYALDNEMQQLNNVHIMQGGEVFPTFGHSIFRGKIIQTVSCKSCSYNSVTDHSLDGLELAVSSKHRPTRSKPSLGSIQDCLTLFFYDMTTCENCSKVGPPCCLPTDRQTDLLSAQDIQDTSSGKHMLDDHSAQQVEETRDEQTDANGSSIQRLITKLPPVLTIQLKRYITDLSKLRGHVSFKEILHLGPFMDPSSEDKDNSSYRLVGVIVHLGNTRNEGHYIAYVRGSGSSWFCASDTVIRKVSLEEVLGCEAYILLYERVDWEMLARNGNNERGMGAGDDASGDVSIDEACITRDEAMEKRVSSQRGCPAETQIFVKTIRGSTISTQVDLSKESGILREIMKDRGEIITAAQNFEFNHKLLDNVSELRSFGLMRNCTVNVCQGLLGGHISLPDYPLENIMVMTPIPDQQEDEPKFTPGGCKIFQGLVRVVVNTITGGQCWTCVPLTLEQFYVENGEVHAEPGELGDATGRLIEWNLWDLANEIRSFFVLDNKRPAYVDHLVTMLRRGIGDREELGDEYRLALLGNFAQLPSMCRQNILLQVKIMFDGLSIQRKQDFIYILQRCVINRQWFNCVEQNWVTHRTFVNGYYLDSKEYAFWLSRNYTSHAPQNSWLGQQQLYVCDDGSEILLYLCLGDFLADAIARLIEEGFFQELLHMEVTRTDW
ncbi:hypothetical protein QYE76_031869 [Lolium multiflorum]|uniref:Ubiquitinyl hydrolase 1 n=1 Tax=Lolium multiflorum TaxID=4521 RepID=A0AAD8VK35_LOLMU|nr:hypothetical protein QYE76_031869 [Lolium multiflorum]